MSTSISVDATTGVAYIRLTEDKIVRSVESSDGLVLDLNEFDIVVGIEILDLSTSYSINDVVNAAHVNSGDEDRVAMCLQTVGRMKLTSSALNHDSRVQVPSADGRTLESC